MRLVNNDTAGARNDLDLAIVKGYRSDGVYDLRAQLKLQEGDLKGALSDLDNAINLNSNNPRTYMSRAGVRLELEDRAGAFSDFNQVVVWYEAGPQKQKALKTDAKSTAPNAEAKTVPDTGAKQETGAGPSIISKVEVAVETSKESPDSKELADVISSAYQNRGMIFSAQGNTDAAMADFNKAIRIFPADFAIYYNRALEWEKRGDLSKAMSDINKAIATDPNSGNSILEHGVILTLLGKTQEAQADFDLLIGSDPVFRTRIEKRLAEAKKNFGTQRRP